MVMDVLLVAWACLGRHILFEERITIEWVWVGNCGGADDNADCNGNVCWEKKGGDGVGTVGCKEVPSTGSYENK